ncbi:MAG: NADH-quinone oxidoreductase subunit N [Chloroflexi bacterium]|nr:NADH-quinone oxidoreductase subunit N [Chloroflexota bacterium]
MNLYLLSPEISVFGLAIAVILLDLLPVRKGWLAAASVLGLGVPLGFAIALWGDWDNTFAGMLVVDQFSLFFKFLFLGVAALVILASADYVSKFPRFQGEYYALILFAAGGMMLLASTRELISIYIALELTAVSLAALACFLKDVRSTEAALKYIILSAISSAVLLYGMALVFGLSGSTRLEDIAAAVTAGRAWDSPPLLLGIVLLVAGFGFKIASVPFQMWVPDVYEGAPTPIAAYLSVASKAAGFAIVLRVFFSAFGQPETLSLDWGDLFAVLAAITMTLGNVMALPQTNIKRLMGYSSIAHAGYIMVGLASVTLISRDLGQSGVLFYLSAYTFTNLAAFIAIIAISNRVGSDLIADYAGMVRRAPVLALALAFAFISLIGIPPTAGFMAKIYIFNAGIQNDLTWLVIVGVINSVISAYYYLRVIRIMFLAKPVSEEKVPSSPALRLSLTLTTVGVLVVGLVPYPLLRAAEIAVRAFS